MANKRGNKKESLPDLSVIIPVFNATKDLETLVTRFLSAENSGVSVEIIIADDGSAAEHQQVIKDVCRQDRRISSSRSRGNLGAGIARNRGWTRARGRYTMFFDADDRIHEDVLLSAISRLDDAPDVDTAVYAYRYEREEDATFTEMSFGDKKIFHDILGSQTMTSGPPETMGALLRFTNYPWNKVIRTSHFKTNDLRFGSTKVNNDILGHWMSLLFPRKIMVVNEVICTHIVHPKGGNLTNQFGPERLELITSISELYSFLEEHPNFRQRFSHEFWSFTKALYNWARPRLSAELQSEFDFGYADLIGRMDIRDYMRMRKTLAPDLAQDLSRYLIY